MSIQEQLESIYHEKGNLTPSIVLAEATRPDHPLHDRFDWSDTQAAHRWRLHQARALIQSVNVVIDREDDRPPIVVRAFVSESEMGRGAKGEDPSVGAYVPVTNVIASDVLRTAWFNTLRRDWERLKAKAAGSQEFAEMVLADLRDMAG